MLKKWCQKQILNITNWATTTALIAVKINVPSVSSLVEITDCNTKIIEIKKKLMIMIMINILLLEKLISWQQKILLQDYDKHI